MTDNEDADLALALELQAQWDAEDTALAMQANAEIMDLLPKNHRTPSEVSGGQKCETSLVAAEWEDVDPTPDLHALFQQYDRRFFWGTLAACEVRWSPRMTLCAGICSYQHRSGYCSIRLSVPLLKLRPRSDLVETLLHEMIHAYLFVTDGNDDHDGHGPAFHQHMYRINREAGTKISVYHTFHDEVASYHTHWWQCNGPCRQRKPFFGLVKRSMNRPPGKNDRWWNEHQATCGGTFIKIKEPEGYGKKKAGKRKLQMDDAAAKQSQDIRSLIAGGAPKAKGKENKATPTDKAIKGKPSSTVTSGGVDSGGGARGNIFGFGGTSFSGPSGGGIKVGGIDRSL